MKRASYVYVQACFEDAKRFRQSLKKLRNLKPTETLVFQDETGFKIWIYVDRRAPWRKGEEIREYIKSHRELELRVRYLPSYHPALNIQEGVWCRMRYEISTNYWFEDLETIWETVQLSFRRWTPRKVKQLCNII